MVFVDKNLFAQRMRKYPEGRISINNTATELSLKPGENELLIGVANDFYGWGIMARLESTEGITETGKVADILAAAKEIGSLDLNQYEGIYSSSEFSYKLNFTRKDKQLFVQVTGQEPAQLQTLGKDRFAYVSANVTFDFMPDTKKLMLRQANESKEFQKE